MQPKNLLHETFLSFAQNQDNFRKEQIRLQGFAVSSADFVQNLGIWFVLYENYPSFVRNLKRFRGEGSSAAFS